MIDVTEIDSIAYDMSEVIEVIDPHRLNKLLEPMATEEELYSLSNSLIESDFTNKNDSILVIFEDGKYKIIDGKNRFLALKNINAKKIYMKIISKDSKDSEIKGLIMQKITRRDKSKTQKAIGAFKYYLEFKYSDNETIASCATKFGCSKRMVDDCLTIHRLGKDDILDQLFHGGVFKYKTVNKATNEEVTKQTSSVSIVVSILKTTQESIEHEKSISKSDSYKMEKDSFKEILVNAIQKCDNDDVAKLLKDAYSLTTNRLLIDK